MTHFAGNGKVWRTTPPSALHRRRPGFAAKCTAGGLRLFRRRTQMPYCLAFLTRTFPLRTLLVTTIRSLRRSQGSAFKF